MSVLALLLATELVIVNVDTAIVAEGPALPLTEPHIAVHPENAGHLLVGVIASSPERPGPWHCAALASHDAGRTWIRTDFEMDRCIDPWVVFTPSHALMFAVEIHDEEELSYEDRFELRLYKSSDGGRTWPERESLGRGHDHEIVVGRDAELYLTSTRLRRSNEGEPRRAIHVAHSPNDGRSFLDLAELRPSNLNFNPTGLGLLGKRTLAISFIDYQRNVDGFDERGMLSQPRAWLVRSEDGGRSFTEPLFITEACGMRGEFPGYPFLTADASREHLYHLCVRPGFEGLALSVSSDRGEKWRELAVDSPHARTPMLAVNPAGVLGLAWYDRRNDPERNCQDLYFTASTDFGENVLEPIRISTETSCPQTEGNGAAGRGWPSGGDYSSLTTAPDGSFRVVWADSREGLFRLRTAAIRVSSD